MAAKAVKHPEPAIDPPCRLASRGLTLVEIVVAIAIVSILLGLAVPSYQRYVQRGHRADAIRSLMEVASCQEMIRAGTGHYDTTRCLDDADTVRYGLRIEPDGQAEALIFTVTATPVDRHADDDCGSLSLDNTGTRRISGSPERLAACWGGR